MYMVGMSPPPAILVLEEPDLSTTLVILLTVILALFVGGISYKWVLGVLGVMIPLAGAFLILIHQPDQTVLNMIFKDHQMERINGYFFPDEFPDQVSTAEEFCHGHRKRNADGEGAEYLHLRIGKKWKLPVRTAM